ncbi:hypothetical protein BDV25DRAFT_156187 [Aspergillus avenaceus]|uniref:CFEM domain-containing protein n=1 Tax=Aspergillus avenaceus TaxID=36643 RepID=A0A5N6TT59_ASPAV|nr:hypothetical protein BDV25DRAFT_156187 [Aspergillus avenaceus]
MLGSHNMLLYLYRLPFTAVLLSALLVFHNGAYGLQLTTSELTQLGTVPNCALSCVKTFVGSDYPKSACPDASDISCLCTTRTKSGYTLGEAALRCSLSLCSIDVAFSSSVYSICDSVPGALPRTHGTLTATIVSSRPTNTFEIGTETSIRSSVSAHSTTTSANFQDPVTVTNNGQRTSSTHTAQPTSHNVTSAGNHESSLNAGTVIGVSVTSGIAGFFILGVIVFFCCRKMKRRYQQPKDQNFFEIGGVMSEPPEFSLPPRRPTPGPNSSYHTVNGVSETSRLMSPARPSPRNPAVIVTAPEGGNSHGRARPHNPDEIGFAFSSTPDLEPSLNNSSPRTLSDLLPDKPVYPLYPEPLRWSQQKSARHNSGETLFEEDVNRPRSFLGASSHYRSLPKLPFSSDKNRRYKRLPKIGLPDNPRAMFHGYQTPQDNMCLEDPDRGKRPVYSNTGEKIPDPCQANFVSKSSTPLPQTRNTQCTDYVDDYWRGPYVRNADDFTGMSSDTTINQPSHDTGGKMNMLGSSGDEFETININDSGDTHRTSRHSGSFRPLSPVKEVKTPKNEVQTRDYLGESAPVNYPRMPFSRAISPAQEIVSRPRIVRRDDIKRVQIRRGKLQPKGLAVLYTPEDYWDEHSGGSSSEVKQHRLSSGLQPSAKTRTGTPKKKQPSSEHNVTPSRRGSDLILHVE